MGGELSCTSYLAFHRNYRTMHYGAKHGIETACRPSVRLSVRLWRWWIMDMEHMGWKYWKLIARTIINSPIPSLFVAQRPSPWYAHAGEHGKILGRLQVGWEKVTCWSTKAASLKRVKIEEKLLWMAYRATNFKFGLNNNSKGPSKQKPIKNFGEKGAWAYPETVQIFGGNPYYLRNR